MLILIKFNHSIVMKRSIIFLFAVFLYSSFGLSISKENDIQVIVDVLQSFNKPSFVISNLCWTHSVKKKLTLSLAESTNAKFIKFIMDVHTKDLIDSEKVVFLVDIRCKESTKFLNKAAYGKYFERPHRWLIINHPKADVIPSEIEKMNLLPDSEVYIMQLNNNSYSINLVYKVKPSRHWITENYGNWSAVGGLAVFNRATDVAIAMRRRNLARESIITSIVLSDISSLEDMEVLRFKHIDVVAKCGYHQTTPLYEFMNATRQLILTEAWGYYANGSWHGMLGHLADEKAEIAGAVMFITKERMSVIEYMSHPTASSVKFIFRQPPLSYQNNLYLLPFRASVWYCIGTFVVVLIAVIYVNAYWETRKVADAKEANDTTVLLPNLSDVSVFVMSAITQQGSNVQLKGLLGRFVIVILFLVFLFLYTAYSASIVVLLQSSSNQIRTLTDLLNSKLELGVEDTPYNRYWFMHEKEPVRRAIYEKKIAPSGSKPKFFNLTEGILQLQKSFQDFSRIPSSDPNLVTMEPAIKYTLSNKNSYLCNKRGKLVFLASVDFESQKPFALNCYLGSAYKVMERYFYEHEKCGLQEISYIQDNNPWQAVRKGSPYREIFKIGLLRNGEHGLNDRTNRIMFSKKPVCSVRGGSFVSVSLVDCYPILLLLLYGMILGVVLLLAEILHHRNNFTDCKTRKHSKGSAWSGMSGILEN